MKTIPSVALAILFFAGSFNEVSAHNWRSMCFSQHGGYSYHQRSYSYYPRSYVNYPSYGSYGNYSSFGTYPRCQTYSSYAADYRFLQIQLLSRDGLFVLSNFQIWKLLRCELFLVRIHRY